MLKLIFLGPPAIYFAGVGVASAQMFKAAENLPLAEALLRGSLWPFDLMRALGLT